MTLKGMALVLAIVALMTVTLDAQAPSQAPPAPAPEPQAAPAPLEPQGFTYNPANRRDPFVSLVGRGASIGPVAGPRPAGLPGLTVAEVTLKGTLQGEAGFVAILQGADTKTYIVRPGDRLLDGTIRTITPTAVVFVQQVNDPLSLAKQREVRKTLRQTEAN